MNKSFKFHLATLCLSFPTVKKRALEKKHQTTYAILRPLGNASHISTWRGRDACILKAAMKAWRVMQILIVNNILECQRYNKMLHIFLLTHFECCLCFCHSMFYQSF